MYRQAPTSAKLSKPLIARYGFLKTRAVILAIIGIYFIPFGIGAWMVVFQIFKALFSGVKYYQHPEAMVSMLLYSWMAVGILWVYVVLVSTMFARRKATLAKVAKMGYWLSSGFCVVLAVLSLNPIPLVGVFFSFSAQMSINKTFLDQIPDDL